MEYNFKSGLYVQITKGEDGWNINMHGGTLAKPLMGTFSSYQKMLQEIQGYLFLNGTDNEIMEFNRKLEKIRDSLD